MDHKQIWAETHTQLQQSMKKEIEAMREILANMHQEELSLLLNDRKTWAQVMEERAALIARLSDLRDSRLLATEKLESLTFPQGKPEEVPLEQLLPPEDENSCETLFLRDQMVALIDRMNLQSNRNELLSNLSESHQRHPQPEMQAAPKAKKSKISIATLPPKE